MLARISETQNEESLGKIILFNCKRRYPVCFRLDVELQDHHKQRWNMYIGTKSWPRIHISAFYVEFGRYFLLIMDLKIRIRLQDGWQCPEITPSIWMSISRNFSMERSSFYDTDIFFSVDSHLSETEYSRDNGSIKKPSSKVWKKRHVDSW